MYTPTSVRQTQRLFLHDVGQPHAKPRPIARTGPNLCAGLRDDDDPDTSIPAAANASMP